MIPKRAIFFWEGPEMSWLRKQSIETFRLLNPTWQIEVIDGTGVPIPGGGRLQTVWRSDWARYMRLSVTGGVYFDTDIVFCRPIPDEWLESDLLLPLSDNNLLDHVAVLGSAPGSKFFRSLVERCRASIPQDGVMTYQHFGLDLMENKPELSPLQIEEKVHWTEPSHFIPVWCTMVDYCWRRPNGEPDNIYGLHWFGGDWLSMELEKHVDEAWARSSDSLIAVVWRMAQRHGSDAEVLREQHCI